MIRHSITVKPLETDLSLRSQISLSIPHSGLGDRGQCQIHCSLWHSVKLPAQAWLSTSSHRFWGPFLWPASFRKSQCSTLVVDVWKQHVAQVSVPSTDILSPSKTGYVSGIRFGLLEHSVKATKSLECSVTGSCAIGGIQMTSCHAPALTWSKIFLKVTTVCHAINSH